MYITKTQTKTTSGIKGFISEKTNSIRNAMNNRIKMKA